MNVIAKILSTEKFEIDGKKFVKVQGFINGLGVFKQTVREELVPDSLENKECCLSFALGLDEKCKPYIRLKAISLDLNTEKVSDDMSVPY
jgi:hypothetical protein